MLDRRRFLASASAAAAFAATPLVAGQPAASSSGPPLTSDIGRLRRVLVSRIGPEFPLSDRLDTSLLPEFDSDLPAARAQHEALLALLKAQGAELVFVEDALSEAIAATRASGVFAAWIESAYPSLAPLLPNVTPAMILGRDPNRNFRLNAAGDFRPGENQLGGLVFTRDSAMMAPRGLVMGRAVSHRRRRENMILRYLYAHAPGLARYPIAFDAVEEGINVEGGDFMVVDRRTLFLGVGSITDPRAAPILARALDMDVLAVQKAKVDFTRPRLPGTPWKLRELRVLLLHLDTFFTQVAPRHALTVPFLLEQAHAEDNPLARFIRGARAESEMDEGDAEAALELLKDFGRVTLYRAGSGKAEDLGDPKLVDYLRKQGWRFTFVGGPPPAGDEARFRHFMETVHPELHRQAANVVQATPGRVIAYAGNPRTKAALEADGIAVDTFEARELWAWSGGPHCLTQPLERS